MLPFARGRGGFLSAVRIKGDKTDWRTFGQKADFGICPYVYANAGWEVKGDAVKTRKN